MAERNYSREGIEERAKQAMSTGLTPEELTDAIERRRPKDIRKQEPKINKVLKYRRY